MKNKKCLGILGLIVVALLLTGCGSKNQLTCTMKQDYGDSLMPNAKVTVEDEITVTFDKNGEMITNVSNKQVIEIISDEFTDDNMDVLVSNAKEECEKSAEKLDKCDVNKSENKLTLTRDGKPESFDLEEKMTKDETIKFLEKAGYSCSGESKVEDAGTKSKKLAMLDIASTYIDSVRTKVNEASDFKFFDTETLYLVPVGHDDSKSCSKASKSPFNDTWKYAYVGVVYNGVGYTYYFTAKDGANYGINMIEFDDLFESDSDIVVTDASNLLENYYGNSSNAGLYITSNCTDSPSCTGWEIEDDIISINGNKLDVKYVVVIDSATCEYSG